ncbi:MAG: alkaline phosphatase family protein [Acidobacteria bacterium]|nr:alkaline phosphatase family protein [Acidobacteriota bacterium]
MIVASFDGFGYAAWSSDPVARELRAVRRVAARGVTARGMIAAFPSTTANSHAAMWTGAWSDVNGIAANDNPVLPRSAHTFRERTQGFRADGLLAEPLWVAAARQGVRVVAHQPPQSYPFLPVNTAPGAVLVNGYQTERLVPHAVIRPADTTPEEPWAPGATRAFRWSTGGRTFHGAFVGRRLFIALDPAGPRVHAEARPLETTPPNGRALGRHFSDPLPVASNAIYFRLFQGGDDFLLYQTEARAVAAHGGDIAGLVREAGGFLGGGPNRLYRDGALGKTLRDGGDGAAERRYLEAVELVIRQFNRHTGWLWRRFAPRLLVDYTPYPDEVDHTWLGWKEMEPYRRWAYIAWDQRAKFLDALAGPRDHVVFVSDHGMAAVSRQVDIPGALERAGLADKAAYIYNCILLNTDDWRGGLIPPSARRAVIEEVKSALRAILDPETGQPVITAFFEPDAGPAGADLYFDLAPGWASSRGPGVHGFLPTRPDMLASLIARGPRLPRGAEWPTVRAIDVAAIVADLLGGAAAERSSGTSPVARQKGKRDKVASRFLMGACAPLAVRQRTSLALLLL